MQPCIGKHFRGTLRWCACGHYSSHCCIDAWANARLCRQLKRVHSERWDGRLGQKTRGSVRIAVRTLKSVEARREGRRTAHSKLKVALSMYRQLRRTCAAECEVGGCIRQDRKSHSQLPFDNQQLMYMHVKQPTRHDGKMTTSKMQTSVSQGRVLEMFFRTVKGLGKSSSYLGAGRYLARC